MFFNNFSLVLMDDKAIAASAALQQRPQEDVEALKHAQWKGAAMTINGDAR
jgi:hypothetical protein